MLKNLDNYTLPIEISSVYIDIYHLPNNYYLI